MFELSSSSQPVIVQQVIFGKRPDCPLPKSLNGKFDALPPIEVNKALLSVKRVVQAGNPVVFDSQGSYVEDTYTGERLPLREEGGMYMLKLWVRKPF